MQTCTRCLMDQTDHRITFDNSGVCNHCHTYDQKVKTFVVSGQEGRTKAGEIMGKIRRSMGPNTMYNCIIGVSGGVDSSYLAYLVKEVYGMKPIAVHFDNGWDTDEAVSNIQTVLEKLNIPLITHVVDWEEFRDLQVSFIKSGTPDLEIPTDHAIVAILNRIALQFHIPYIISGANVRTETHVPSTWSQGHWDWRYVKSVHNEFGNIPLTTYPFMSLRELMKVKWVRILNYLDYDKEDAKDFLIRNLGWKDYGWKHHESIYTRFYQGYILPVRFGYDKRKSHLSSLICSGIISREEGLRILNEGKEYPFEQVRKDYDYVLKKLEIPPGKFIEYMRMPKKTYDDYPNIKWILKSNLFQKIYQRRTRIDG
jgi:N-acetyl sugar amidotransferase